VLTAQSIARAAWQSWTPADTSAAALPAAVITIAGNLPATYVIHAVAPRYSGKLHDADLLRGAYATSLALARDHGLRTIAFPSLGTGA